VHNPRSTPYSGFFEIRSAFPISAAQKFMNITDSLPVWDFMINFTEPRTITDNQGNDELQYIHHIDSQIINPGEVAYFRIFDNSSEI
jgi:hypothetical protein